MNTTRRKARDEPDESAQNVLVVGGSHFGLAVAEYLTEDRPQLAYVLLHVAMIQPHGTRYHPTRKIVWDRTYCTSLFEISRRGCHGSQGRSCSSRAIRSRTWPDPRPRRDARLDHRQYDSPEMNRDYRVALRMFGRHVTDGDDVLQDHGVRPATSAAPTSAPSSRR